MMSFRILLFLTVIFIQTCTVYSTFIVDASSLFDSKGSDPIARLSAAEGIDQALQHYGLVILTGHNISDSSMTESFSASRELFDLSLSAKKLSAISNDAQSFGRGYLGFGDESGVSSTFEPKEGYSYGSPEASKPPENLLNIANKWPKGLSSHSKDTLQRLYQQKISVSKVVVNALSSQFMCDDENSHTLQSIARGGDKISLMRMFHYFHQDSPIVQEKLRSTTTATQAFSADTKAVRSEISMLGSSPHTDWGFLTVILADNVGGLQFIPRGGSIAKGDWVDVPHIPGSLIINGGDYLSLISRGVYHSPIHRVLTPGSNKPTSANSREGSNTGVSSGSSMTTDRYSFVLFYYPSYESPVRYDALGHCTHISVQEKYDGMNKVESEVNKEGNTPTSALIEQKAEEISYNTLLKLDGDKPDLFGDYVVRKWQGVYRK